MSPDRNRGRLWLEASISCTTLYAFRERRRWTFSTEKYGQVDVSSPDSVRARLHRPTHEASLGGWLCRGVLVDSTRRLARVHACHSDRRAAGIREWERSVQASVEWEGWDVGDAWGETMNRLRSWDTRRQRCLSRRRSLIQAGSCRSLWATSSDSHG